MRFDVFTILASACALVMVMGLQVLFFWSRDRGARWLGWCAAAFLMVGVAVLIYFLPGDRPAFVSLGLSNLFRIGAFGAMWLTMRTFGGRNAEVLPVVLVGALWLALSSFSGFIANEALRIGVVSTIVLVFCLLAIHELWRARAEKLPSRMPAIIVATSFAALALVRIVLVQVLPFPMGANPENSMWVAGYVLVVALHAAFLAALVIAMTKERRELEQRNFALRDPMTGLFNRRAFLDLVGGAGPKDHWMAEDTGLLVLDLDRFKSINDRFGHEVGDRVLARFAQVARECVRPNDLLFRMGGEEFCFVLPGAGIEGARAVAERVRSRFAQNTLLVGVQAIQATVSIGIAISEPTGTLESVMAAADAALYEAKARGRDIIVAAEPAKRLRRLAGMVRPLTGERRRRA